MDANASLSATASSTSALPETGEALISMKTFADALGVSESTAWSWSKDPDFPELVRKGERFTRLRLSDARKYIAEMPSGKAKVPPTVRSKEAA